MVSFKLSRCLCFFRSTLAASSSNLLHTTSVNRWQNFENERHFEPGDDAYKRTWYALIYDFRRWRRRYFEARKDAFRRYNPVAHMKRAVIDLELFPFESTVLIIGGGLSGTATAFWIKEYMRDEDFKVVVVENNDKFPQSSSLLTFGGVSQLHYLPEHVEMSMFATEFLRHAGEHLRILDSDPPDINLLPMGFLRLARTDEEVERLRDSWKLTVSKGARISILDRDELKQQFPFMNFEDISLGTYGLENEGTIDSWQLLSAMREKNISLGVQYIKGEVEGFMFTDDPVKKEVHGFVDDEIADEIKQRQKILKGAYVRPQMTDASARPIRAKFIINAAGPWAGDIGEMAGVGRGKGLFAIKLPIARRKRMYFVVQVPDAPLDMPAIIDPSGVFCMQEELGKTYVCGKTPTEEEDEQIDHTNLEIDYDYFYEKVWPVLAKRVPSFQNLKIKNAWGTYEGVNTFDNSPIIGEHFHYKNFWMLCGLGNRSLLHSIAGGRAFSEKILNDAYSTILLRKFDMRRLLLQKKIKEYY